MLLAAEINYRGSDVDTIVRRFSGVGNDEFPEGVRLVNRYHSPGTKWAVVVVDVDNVVA